MDMNSTGIMVLRTAVFLSGIFIIGGTLVAAIKTFIMPRGVNVWLTRVVFRSIGFFFGCACAGRAMKSGIASWRFSRRWPSF